MVLQRRANKDQPEGRKEEGNSDQDDSFSKALSGLSEWSQVDPDETSGSKESRFKPALRPVPLRRAVTPERKLKGMWLAPPRRGERTREQDGL